jgi:shikimate kinase
MKIILMGYMGSGKSTIGLQLANILGFTFVDLDAYIEAKESSSIPELFKSKGEIYFRKKESSYLKELLNTNESSVIALGGGTPCYGINLQLILETDNAKSVYLKLSIPSLVKRLELEKSKRPLISHLKTQEELTEFIGKHLFERSPYYSQANEIIIADEKSVDDIVEAIILKLF